MNVCMSVNCELCLQFNLHKNLKKMKIFFFKDNENKINLNWILLIDV